MCCHPPAAKAHLHASRDRVRAAGGVSGQAQPKSHYLVELKSEKAQMRKPSGDDSLSWRKPSERSERSDSRSERSDGAGRSGSGRWVRGVRRGGGGGWGA